MTPAELAKLRKDLDIVIVPESEIDEQTGLTLSEKARLTAQGALFNFSDEGAALFRSLLGEDYDDAVADERAQLEKARGKDGSLKYEIGGAIVPALLAAPFTGGTSIGITAGRLAAMGGVQALTAGVGAREGNVVERVTKDPTALAAESAVGAVAGPALGKAVQYGGKAISTLAKPGGYLARLATGRISRPVETEVRRLAESSGVPFDEIVERIGRSYPNTGEIFPDLSEQAAQDVAGLYASSGKGGQAIADVVTRRADKIPSQARATMQADLVPNVITGNITKWFGKKIKDIKSAESASYDKIFEKGIEPSDTLNLAIKDLLQNQRWLGNKVNTVRRAKRINSPLWETVEGQVKLLDDVSLKEAEIIRRSLYAKSQKAWKDGDGDLGEAVGDLEDGLREIMDKASPELAATRSGWRKVKKLSETFDEGKKVLDKPTEEAEILLDEILASGDDDLIDAFRSGVGFRLKTKAEKPRGATAQIRDLANENSGISYILERLYPGDSVEAAFRKIDLANKALTTKTRVIGGSPTAGRLEAVARQGSAGDIAVDAADMVITGNVVSPIRNFVKRALAGKSGLNQKQQEQVSRIIITEDPQIMKRALNDPEVQQLLVNRINQVANLVQRGAGAAGSYEGGEITRESEYSSALDSLVKGLTDSAAAKVKAISPQ
jgi:hypothetical protein